ncbi:TRAP transporter small permease [Nereida sp. MMG025]|uniref:TRAP transporter small permease n=1 Tax=Nereida sp. MMG025 TaxID=2909981 RepID=UPI001F3174AE|nr:TRAP transporter small permease [Nereida sp. MMG025]MCF6443542.1 TRAP transporter small permease [Nereida sp. MMG025]
MKNLMNMLFAGVDILCRSLLVALSLSVLSTVFGRYILNSTPRWGEELALTLIVWLSLLAVPLGFRNGWHIRLDLLQRSLAPVGKRGLDGLNWILSFGMGILFVWYGVKIAIQNLSNLMPGLGISAFWQYLSVPVSGVLIVIALAEIALTRTPETPVEGAPRK